MHNDEKTSPISLHAYDEIVLRVWLGEIVAIPAVGLALGTILESLFLEHFAGDLLRGAGVLTGAFVFLSAHMKVSSLNASIHVTDPRQQHIFEINKDLQFWSMGMLAVYAATVAIHSKVDAGVHAAMVASPMLELAWGLASFSFNVLILAFSSAKCLAAIQDARASFLDLYISAVEREVRKLIQDGAGGGRAE